MKWLACVILAIALIATTAHAGVAEARVHVKSALDTLGLAEKDAEVIAEAYLQSQKEFKAMREWGVGQQARADEAEGTIGYRVEMWIRRALAFVVGAAIALYAAFIILKLIGLCATGPFGAVVSWGTSIGLGWLPGAGWMDTVFSNIFWRVIKPRS